jgi:outer membrane protein
MEIAVNRQCAGALMCVLLGNMARSDDLSMIFRDALANNAQYQSAQAQYAAYSERIPQSRAGLLPTLSASGNTTWNENQSNIFGRQRYNSNGYTVTLTQPLFRAPAILELSEAHAQVDQAKAQLDSALQDLMLRTAQAYFDVLFAEDALNTFRAQGAADLQQLQQAQRSFDIGTMTTTDVRDAQARYDVVNAQTINAQNELAAKTNGLRQIINREPGSLMPLRAGIVLESPMPSTLAPWERAAESDNISVIAGRAALQAAQRETQRARATFLPTFDFVATYGSNKSAYSIEVGNQNKGSTVGVQVTVPLFTGGATSSHLRESFSLQKKANADLEEARRVSVLSAQQAYLGATSGLAQVKALGVALESSRTALQANRRGMDVGTRINIDVLNAEQQVAVIERDLAKSRYETLMSLLRLKAAAGSLGASDMDEVNALLASSTGEK